MCPRRGCAAQADIAQHLPLLVRQCVAPALEELLLKSTEDIGHFEPMPVFGERKDARVGLKATTLVSELG